MDYIATLLNQPNFKLKTCLQQIEIDLIKTALLQNACSQIHSAKALGISRAALNDRITKYQINQNEIYSTYKSINLQNLYKLIKDHPELKKLK